MLVRLFGLQIYIFCIDSKAKIIIFNRYGEVVFEAQSASQYWNGTYKGKPIPMGGYTYVIDLKNNAAVLRGVVFVVR